MRQARLDHAASSLTARLNFASGPLHRPSGKWAQCPPSVSPSRGAPPLDPVRGEPRDIDPDTSERTDQRLDLEHVTLSASANFPEHDPDNPSVV